jgi:hypothetical protein
MGFAIFNVARDLDLSPPVVSSRTDADGDEGGDAAESSLWAVAALQRDLAWYASFIKPRWRAAHSVRVPVLSQGLVHAVERALTEAHAVGVAFPTDRHLVLGLLLDPTNRAAQILAQAGVDRDVWISALRDHESIRWDAPPPAALGEILRDGRTVFEWFFRAAYLIGGVRFGGLVVVAVAADSMKLAARLGHARANSAHVLCVLLQADEDIECSEGSELRPDIAAHNTAGVVLGEVSVTLTSLIAAAAEMPDEQPFPFRSRGNFIPGSALRSWSESGETACRVAVDFARTLGHRHVGTTHLLAACLDDPDSAASRLLGSLDVDVARVRDEAKRRLAGRG